MASIPYFRFSGKRIALFLVCATFVVACSKNEYEEYLAMDPMQERASFTANSTFFGPETFTISSRGHLDATTKVGNQDVQDYENFVLVVQNGPTAKTRVAHFEIKIDGITVLTGKDFIRNRKASSKPIKALAAGSVMEIKMNGSKGRFITVKIECSPKANLITDIDGNRYKTVLIGNQWWMAENLKTTKFNDGTSIPEIRDDDEWLSSAMAPVPAFCWYGNDQGYKNIYGALYNWEACADEKICPEGWHVPDSYDVLELCLFLDENSVIGVYSDIAAGMLKEAGTSHWLSPNTGATDEFGFTALPAGYRNVFGAFVNQGMNASFWSDNGYSSYHMTYNSTSVTFSEGGNEYGRSIRCIKD
jgi:uncharacterized protein (TIGR02145 family)